ncbi:2,4-dienoyl-CoA reductase [Sphingomonas guangdongensis]|uniref:2,4-dienoyl-CoA reductase n=1 Tax=Sphingomonas guangdongensis TaxID=1141890 RepID=A0A285QFJ3_9SPHN|nr:alkene reductase [Sphingomonas guangdongensis]SOB80264.1 2,4-dienoyl-CoA reductase [Sphingomonas guangdongensis]
MPSLFDPISYGAIDAPNRLVMAPLTRGRATDDHVPTPIMAEYYRQRATAGLIISEGTGISFEGLGWPNAPGIWSDEQVEAWKPITDAVHDAGGRIVTQLWHLGRLARQDVTGQAPFSSSATQAPARPGATENPNVAARAMTGDDIARTLDDFARAARNAIRAGFDGVELHAANGYLIDQFMRDGTNHRDDDYGGPVENRLRLLREVVGRLLDEAGAQRTGVRFSPNGEVQGCDDSNPEAVFVPAAAFLDSVGAAFLELRESGPDDSFLQSQVAKLSPKIREVFSGPLILNQDFDLAKAQTALDGVADAISFGRPFLANPDLVERLRTGAPLNEPDKRTFYTRGTEGYTDYPALELAS